MREVIVMCGLPFSGKTTLARQLMHDDALLLERDRFLEDVRESETTRGMLMMVAKNVKQPVTTYFATKEQNAWNDALTSLYVTRLSDALPKQTEGRVIVDGTHLQPLSRRFIADLDGWTKIAVVFSPDVKTSVARLAEAQAALSGVRATVTPQMIERMSAAFMRPTAEEGFDRILTPEQALATLVRREPSEA